MRRVTVPRIHGARRCGGRDTRRPIPGTPVKAQGWAVVGISNQHPVSRANGWPGRSKPRGASRMAQTQSHYRPSPPLLQGADNDLPEMSAWPSQAVRVR